MENTRPIIIIKKKGGHGGHHGGAWKVAYADFVTAMMALFIVLWLLNSSKQIQVAVGGYFKDPTGTAKEVGSTLTGTGESVTLTRDNMPKLKEQLETAIREMNDFDKLKSHIETTVTAEGLRIELTESAAGTFFKTGSDSLNGDRRELLIMLGKSWASCPTKSRSKGTPTLPPMRPWRTMATGTVRGPRQCGPPSDAKQWHSGRSSDPGARIRRSTTTQTREPARSIQPPDFAHCAVRPHK